MSIFFVSQKAYYAHPMVAAAVIIHLAADGTADIDQRQHNITVQLVDTKEQTHPLGQSQLQSHNISNTPFIPSCVWKVIFLLYILRWLDGYRGLEAELPEQSTGDSCKSWPERGFLPDKSHYSELQLSSGGHLRCWAALLSIFWPHHYQRLPEQWNLQPHGPKVRK